MKKNLIKIWKELVRPFLLFIAITAVLLTVTVPVNAQTASGVLQNIGKGTGLPSYDTNGHANASSEQGARNITSAIYYAGDLVKYIIGTLAVVMIIISGIKLVVAGKGSEEESGKQKENLKYALIGLVIIMVADVFVKNVFFGAQGEIYSSKTTIQEAAKAGSEQIKAIYRFMSYFAGAVAILMIVISGFRYMTSGGNEEIMGKTKKQVTYAVLGLVFIGIGELVIQDIIFPNQGSQLPDIEKLKHFIVNLTNFIAGFLSTVAFVMYMYGGYLYVTAFGNEEAAGKAKKIFTGATIGLLLALVAFAIVNTTVKFENQIGAGRTRNPYYYRGQ